MRLAAQPCCRAMCWAAALVSCHLAGPQVKGGGHNKRCPASVRGFLRHARWALHLRPCFVFTAEGPAAAAIELHEPPKTPGQNQRGNQSNLRALLLFKQNNNFNYTWAPLSPAPMHAAFFPCAEGGGGCLQPWPCPQGHRGRGCHRGHRGRSGSLAPLGSRLVFTRRDGASTPHRTMLYAHVGTEILEVGTH